MRCNYKICTESRVLYHPWRSAGAPGDQCVNEAIDTVILNALLQMYQTQYATEILLFLPP